MFMLLDIKSFKSGNFKIQHVAFTSNYFRTEYHLTCLVNLAHKVKAFILLVLKFIYYKSSVTLCNLIYNVE